MKRILFLLLSFLFFNLSNAQSCSSNRYLEEVFTSHSSITNIKYAEAVPYSLLGNAGPQDLFMDIYFPDGDTLSERPVVMHSFGGGYLIGWRTQPNIPTMAEMYTKRGFIFVAIDYRLGFNVVDFSGTSPVQAVFRGMQDCRAALRFLADSAQVYGLDMDNIILTGTSAGSISSIIQTYLDESNIPTLQWDVTPLGGPNNTGNSNNNEMEVPIHGIVNNWGAILDTSYIDVADDPNDMVPLISFHGDQDLIVPYDEGSPFNYPAFPSVQGSELIHQRLDNQGIPNYLHTFSGMGHQPNLLNGWVTDTIISKASAFMYEHVLKPHISPIIGDLNTCTGDTLTYSVDLHLDSYYCWEITGGVIISQNNNQVQVVWNTAGANILIATEVNDILAKDETSITVNVLQMPDATFMTTPQGDGLFDFSNTDNIATNFSWDFDDNTFSSTQSTSHQFSSLGDFDVTLMAINGYCIDSYTETITSDICPDASFDVIFEGENATFNNFSDNATSYEWSFGDNNTTIDENPTHTYDSEGNFDVQLIVNNDFCSDTITQSYNVDFCPTANFDFDYQIGDSMVSFTNLSSNSDVAFWDFGDGSTASGNTANHTYTSEGTYTVQLIVYNSGNCSDTIYQDVTIEACPIPSFSYTSQGLEAQLDADMSSFDSYTWDFGDGNTAENVGNPIYVYAQGGTYTITLTATTSNGCTQSFSHTVTVIDVGIEDIYNNALQIYPSPAVEVLYIDFDFDKVKNSNIKIYNILGKTLFQHKNPSNKTQTIDLKGYTNGIYIVEIQVEDVILVRKFQKK